MGLLTEIANMINAIPKDGYNYGNEVAKQILFEIVAEFDKAIIGQYPQGNSYGEQMERVSKLLDSMRGMRDDRYTRSRYNNGTGGGATS